MKLITTDEAEILIAKATKHYMTPQFPTMKNSKMIIVPRLEFFANEFFIEWRKNAPPNYNRTFCDHVAISAQAFIGNSAGIKADLDGEDAMAALWATKVFIHKAPFLSITDNGGHVTTTILYTLNDIDVFPAIWEPQNPRFQYENLTRACNSIDVYDIWM
jgi:hypothetical protein